MKRFRLTVAYDGTNYAGWQKQPQLRTIEGMIIYTFSNVFSQKMRFLGASRTDAGVHAVGQVAMLDTELDIDAQKLMFVLNNALPNDIVVSGAQLVSDDFHTHHNLISKTYHYHFFTERPSPFNHRYGWYYYRKVDFEKLHKALQYFVGTHDFAAFATDETERETVRTIHSITIDYSDEFKAHRIVITGDKFLRYQIRRMVGTALEIASRPSHDLSFIENKLKQKNPANSLQNAPAKGLFLHHIIYQGDE